MNMFVHPWRNLDWETKQSLSVMCAKRSAIVPVYCPDWSPQRFLLESKSFISRRLVWAHVHAARLSFSSCGLGTPSAITLQSNKGPLTYSTSYYFSQFQICNLKGTVCPKKKKVTSQSFCIVTCWWKVRWSTQNISGDSQQNGVATFS